MIILTISKNRLGLLYHLTLFHNEAEQFVPLEHRMPIQVNNWFGHFLWKMKMMVLAVVVIDY